MQENDNGPEKETQTTMKRSRSASSLCKLENDLSIKIKMCELYSIVGSLQEQMASLVEIIKKQNSEKTKANIEVLSSKEDGINSEKASLGIENPTKEALAIHLLNKEYPTNWKRPKLHQYKGNSDPVDHIHKLLANMEDVMDRRALWCRMFRRTLEGDAMNWYVNLPHNSINNFEELHHKFLDAFNHLIRRKTDQGALLNVKQKESETLRE